MNICYHLYDSNGTSHIRTNKDEQRIIDYAEQRNSDIDILLLAGCILYILSLSYSQNVKINICYL
jgi:hypothetical protein